MLILVELNQTTVRDLEIIPIIYTYMLTSSFRSKIALMIANLENKLFYF